MFEIHVIYLKISFLRKTNDKDEALKQCFVFPEIVFRKTNVNIFFHVIFYLSATYY